MVGSPGLTSIGAAGPEPTRPGGVPTPCLVYNIRADRIGPISARAGWAPSVEPNSAPKPSSRGTTPMVQVRLVERIAGDWCAFIVGHEEDAVVAPSSDEALG